jgi:hypothetical protein
VPVFVGPKPGWTGPVLAARTPDATAPKASPTATDKATPAEASAYVATDKAQALDKDETPALEAPTAPMALQGALKPATAKSLNGPAGKRPPTKLAQQNKLKPPVAAHSAPVKPDPKATSDPSPNPVVAPAR